MTTPEEQCELLDVRQKWSHEGTDFTPWLAKNLGLLGETIGMNLELVQEEKLIGTMYLDILARDADTGELVAIENQLEPTDIDHLGRLLIYAAGCDAKAAIWVAPDFVYEHAQVLHRLNEWTKEPMRFYGVKVEVVKKAGGSQPEARFRKVVYPGGWDKDATLPKDKPPSPEVQQHERFYSPLVRELCQAGFADNATQHWGYIGRRFRSGHDGVWYGVSLEGKNDAWVTLHIQMDDNARTKWLFDQLCAQRAEIEAGIDAGSAMGWAWHRYDRFTFSSINVKGEGSIDDPPEKQEETRAWMLDLLPKFKREFGPRIKAIMESE